MHKRVRPGSLVSIPLGDGTHAYARVLRAASYGFYDYRGSEDLDAGRIVELPIIFFAAVRDSAVKTGRWPVIGYVALDGRLIPPPKFIQDALKPSSFSIYENDGTITNATKDQCVGLERAAVWDPDHIEDRLRDHYAGRENKWVKLLDISRPAVERH